MAECNAFRELYKTKLSALSQQQTHLCSCVSLLRKEGQFYAGFYGWLHKSISLCASSLAGTADSEIIVFSNAQLQ